LLTRETWTRIADIDLLVHAGWEREFPGLVAGTTVAPQDYGLSSSASTWGVTERFEAMTRALGCRASVVCRQVHGSRVIIVDPPPVSGVCIAGEADGLASDGPGVLLTVTTADCVPVYLLDPDSRAFALLHAGWRGAVAGIVERGIRTLEALKGVVPSGLRVHLGPAICGDCYEVGPEVLREFGRPGNDHGRLDLRAWLTEESLRLGVPASAISESIWCTRCSADVLHSHRGSQGAAGRMAAFLGWRVRNE
jgi:hypothetical protein